MAGEGGVGEHDCRTSPRETGVGGSSFLIVVVTASFCSVLTVMEEHPFKKSILLYVNFQNKVFN